MTPEQISPKLETILSAARKVAETHKGWQFVGKRNATNLIGIQVVGPVTEDIPPALDAFINNQFQAAGLPRDEYFSRDRRAVAAPGASR